MLIAELLSQDIDPHIPLGTDGVIIAAEDGERGLKTKSTNEPNEDVAHAVELLFDGCRWSIVALSLFGVARSHVVIDSPAQIIRQRTMLGAGGRIQHVTGHQVKGEVMEMKVKVGGTSNVSETEGSFTEGAKVPTLPEAGDALAEVVTHLRDRLLRRVESPPAAKGNRPTKGPVE